MNPALHHDALALPPAHTRLKLITQHAPASASYSYYAQPQAPYDATRNNRPPDPLDISPAKRRRISDEGFGAPRRPSHHSVIGIEPAAPAAEKAPRARPRETTPRRVEADGSATAADRDGVESRPATAHSGAPATPVASKSRRVRTGCLTCRERHLKCDEGLPDCNNCRKSSRECKRGVRLNFIDIQVKSPPYMQPPVDWSVKFQDESRLIASEYRGGLGRYPRLGPKAITPPREPEPEVISRQHSASARDAIFLPREGYYPATSSGQTPTPGPTSYDESQLAQMRGGLHSRKDSNAALSAHTPASQPDPSPIMGSSGGSFSLTMLNDQYATREDTVPQQRPHVYRGSDASSVASSLVPQGAGPASQNLRPGAAAGPGQGGRGTPDGLMTPPSEKTATGERDYLSDEEEIRFMQIFIDEVAVWMDSYDKDKHFTNITPYLALKSAMLLNAFLACGVKHLTLVESYNDEKALFYYDTATTQLLRSLQNPDRNMAECATTAVVLNVYEIMSEKPTQRMNHIAGARALIRECGWDATTTGIGGACFWLNIGMEVLSCLAFNWQTAWDPDQWGLDLAFTNLTPGGTSSENEAKQRERDAQQQQQQTGGDEELWAHRMFYIVAKIANFRANIPRFQEPSPHDEQVRLQSRFSEWKRLKAMCDAWNNNCPRPMRPYGYSHSPSTTSLFPNVWLIKRPAVIGRLFYHTAMCVLAQINPLNPRDSAENRAAQLHHAHQVCGIVAHTKDRGVASVAIRSLATSASVLTDRHEQTEVLAILDKISKDTGWRLGKVLMQLKKDWGWENVSVSFFGGQPPPQPSATHQNQYGHGHGHHGYQNQIQHHHNHSQHHQHSNSLAAVVTTTAPTPVPPLTTSSASSSSSPPVAAPMPLRPMVNPLLVNADFGHRNHPYKNWYEPPNRSSSSGILYKEQQGFVWSG
ncbi:hypothetical protein B0H66DRAFT_228282 [Apodospora peruviana]|uniref:Zn(2)-C6 fungal-type domain-containing protein n=1 Tax=Apodospora peruviana TaxID=516989 RepID=A0AAE0I5Z8_9PEZI|nr:hypothetical protein B0H66DRAFT_228282 [Apodospora peruviana]